MKKNYILSVLFFLFLGIAANAQNFPVATNDSIVAYSDTTVTIYFLENDTFGEDGPNTDPVSIISNPLYGQVQLLNSPLPNGELGFFIIYTPFPGFSGADSFLYTIKDANGDASTAMINIVVQIANGIATAVNDYATTTENTPIIINALDNDNFGINNPSSGYSYVSINPSNGVAIVNDNGTPFNPLDDTFVYTPNLNFYGQDSFSYTITNSDNNSAMATVFINVIQNPNEPNFPVATNDYASTELNTAIIINVLANDYFGVDGAGVGSITLSSSPLNGTIVVNTNGTPNDPMDDTLTYVPNAGFYGEDNFTYSISDATSDTSTATVHIIVLQSPNGQYFPLASNDYVDCNFDTPITINVLANDSFGNDGPGIGAIAIIAQPLNGIVLVNDNGTPNDPTDDTLVYTPNTNYFGTDSFLYSISDANLDSSTATVYINVLLPNPTSILFEKTAVVQGNGNVGDAIVYTFKITNTTGGTMSSISIYDQMLSPTSIHDIGGLAAGAIDVFNYTYIITQNDLNVGSVTNSAMVFYTDFNGNGVNTFSDDGDLSNGTDNPTITYLNNFPSVVIDVIQPSCAETTGSIVLSNLPSNWTLYYNNSSIESNYTTYTIANLPIGAYNCVLIDLSNGLTQNFYVYIQPSSSGITAGATSTYVDYNNDGFTNVGDVINYQYNVYNNGSCDLTNVGISPTPFLNLDGTTIPVLAAQTSDNTTLFATHVITQEEVNAGNVLLNNGLSYTSGSSTYAIDVFNFTNLTITNGFKLNAFLDINNNGLQDNNEPNFNDGYFTYQLNNGTINNIYSQNGSYYLYEVDPNNLYNITYVLNNQYNQCTGQYVLNTSSYSNVSISNNGFQTLNFAINDGVCNDLAVTMNNGWFSPRPGFNYSNVIYYSNYGNQTIPSGNITFTKDALLSITNVSETAIANNSNGFSFNFTNLLPYETRYIFVDMLVPLIPNINLGDIVTNTVTASTNVSDSSLSNNSATITDIVIGSYDPNDKNESHGGKVLHSGFTANDYLTYTIRFENTGTAEAINVKVTDVLDQKLDETSVRMVAASDDYVLDRIGSNLTWTFSGINLVPSVENTQIGHGYLTFQVKPKTGYLLGDVIPNTANIYFDFNPAIVTNECTTEFVSALAVNNFSENDFSVYPNPTKNILNISAKNKTNTIENIVVFDVVGKAILNQKANTPTTTIDLSNCAKGVYFVKVAGDGFEKMVKVVRD